MKRLRPLIWRECRSLTRRGSTYFWRWATPALLAAVSYVHLRAQNMQLASGDEWFLLLYHVLWGWIWVAVPLSMCDCLSSERREGTLAMLLTAPLRPVDVVLAKSFAQGVRVVSMAIAAVPVFVGPVMAGGVSVSMIAYAVLNLATQMVLALGAGMVASALTRSVSMAGVLAVLVAVFFLGCEVAGLFVLSFFTKGVTGALQEFFDLFDLLRGDMSGLGEWLAELAFGGMNLVSNSPPARRAVSFVTVMTCGAVELVLSLAWVRIWLGFSAGVLRTVMTGRIAAPSRAVTYRPTSVLPPLRRIYHRWRQHVLDRRPLAWLQWRSPAGRVGAVVCWGIGLSALQASLVAPEVMVDLHSDGMFGLGMFHTLMLLPLAWGAALSFRYERDCGVLELLMVTPIGAARLLRQRWAVLVLFFLPAWGFLLLSWLLVVGYLLSDPVVLDLGTGVPFVLLTKQLLVWSLSLVVTPVVGAFFAVRCRHAMASVAWTLMVMAPAAMVVLGLFHLLWPWPFFSPSPSISGLVVSLTQRIAVWADFAMAWQVVAGLACGLGLVWMWRRRTLFMPATARG